jgi:hypothetical protein
MKLPDFPVLVSNFFLFSHYSPFPPLPLDVGHSVQFALLLHTLFPCCLIPFLGSFYFHFSSLSLSVIPGPRLPLSSV